MLNAGAPPEFQVFKSVKAKVVPKPNNSVPHLKHVHGPTTATVEPSKEFNVQLPRNLEAKRGTFLVLFFVSQWYPLRHMAHGS